MKSRVLVIGLGVALALAGLSTPALSDPITFIFSGEGSGTVNGVPFTDADYTITLNGDTANIASPVPGVVALQTEARITIAGVGTATVTEAVGIFDNQDFSALGFQRPNLDLLDVVNPAFGTYGLSTSLGPIPDLTPGALGQFTNLASTLGPITLSDSDNVTFQAILRTPLAIPTLTEWGLLFLIIAVGLLAVWRLRAKPRLL